MSKQANRAAGKAVIRRARMRDIEPIHALVTGYSRGEVMLPRSRAELYEALRDFVVAERGGEVIGCGALTIQWDNLAEIKSLAVAAGHQRRGIGRRLVKACLAEARRLGIGKVFALTMIPGFFEAIGFGQVPKESLPHKVWADCVRCPKFPDCDEVSVVLDLPTRSDPESPA